MANIWSDVVITGKGIALLTKLVDGNTLRLTRVVSASGFVPAVTLYNQTAVTDEQQTLQFMPLSYPETGKVKIPVILSNDGVTTGYTANQVGVYATDPDEGEILLFVAQADQNYGGKVIPTETEMPGYTCEWNFYLQYGQADGVEVYIDPAGILNFQTADERYASKSHENDADVHITAEERALWTSAAGDFDFGFFTERNENSQEGGI